MRIVYFGTPELSVHFLQALTEDARFQVLAVVTQPDEPVGRKKALTAPPVKEFAIQHALPVLQPSSLKDAEVPKNLASLGADAFVVMAYGRIIPQAVLDIPRLGCVNVHPSLLPKYRGPSPIRTAILNGDTETGVTIMKLDAGMDSGPLLAQEKFTIADDETVSSLEKKVVDVGAPLLVQTLIDYAAGKITPKPQDESQVSLCRMLSREDGVIDWTKSAEEIERQVRALEGWPGTTMTWDRGGEQMAVKVFTVEITDQKLPPGAIETAAGHLLVGTATTAMRILEVQPATGKRMSVAEFLRGYKH